MFIISFARAAMEAELWIEEDEEESHLDLQIPSSDLPRMKKLILSDCSVHDLGLMGHRALTPADFSGRFIRFRQEEWK